MIPFALLLLADPMGQHHHMMPGMTMPGMTMAPAKPAAPRKAAKRRVVKPVPKKARATVRACSAEHAAMGHCTPADGKPDAMPGMAGMPKEGAAPACSAEHAAMGHCQAKPETESMPQGMAMDHGTMDHGAMDHGAMDHGTMGHGAMPQQSVGSAPPPPAPTDRAADRFYDPAAMAAANRQMRMEHGGMRFSQILFNLAEVQVRDGRDGYRWDGEGWFGGDIHRLVVKTEGEGAFRDRIGAAEVQALYSRAIDPYWNLQVGVRQDVGGPARRTYAVVGVEGLAPYWFDVEGALFLSDKGELLARTEAWVDQRITQRAILQPRIEVNFAAQDIADQQIAAGVSNLELGLRLRYEIAREFAPYVGVHWERRYGPASGGGAALALGIRTWF